MDLSLGHLLTLPPEHALPDVLPTEPWPRFKAWFDEAVSTPRQPNPNAMTLATVGEDGHPAARIVLCRGMNIENGYIVFYTNYEGAKGRQLKRHPYASVVFHWDHADRQVRIRGPVTRASDEESDAYFRTRAPESRLSAWASKQSERLGSREELARRLGEVAARFGISAADVSEARARKKELAIPRPPHWGGFRIWAESVELWLGGPGRFHDRALWSRTLTEAVDQDTQVYRGSAWTAMRLQP